VVIHYPEHPQRQHRQECQQQRHVAEVLVVHQHLNGHRDDREEQVVHELQPENDLEIETCLEPVVSLQHLDQDAAGHLRHLHRRDHHDQRKEATDERHTLRHRCRIHDLVHLRVAVLPNQLARVQGEERVDDRRDTLGEHRSGHQHRHRPGGCVEDRVAHVPPYEEGDARAAEQHANEPAARRDLLQRAACDGECLARGRPKIERARDMRHLHRAR
jgi:hypothetical protein